MKYIAANTVKLSTRNKYIIKNGPHTLLCGPLFYIINTDEDFVLLIISRKNHFHEEGFYMIIPKYFEDNHIFGVNDEPMRAYYIPTSPAQNPDWKIRTETDRFLLLNGD